MTNDTLSARDVRAFVPAITPPFTKKRAAVVLRRLWSAADLAPTQAPGRATRRELLYAARRSAARRVTSASIARSRERVARVYTFNSISVVFSSVRPNHALMPAVRLAM